MNEINIDDEDGDDEVSEKEQALRLATSMKKLGNMSCKPLNKYATTDVVEHGCALMNKNLRKTCGNTLHMTKKKSRVNMRIYEVIFKTN